ADMSPCASSVQERGRAAGAHDGRSASLARALDVGLEAVDPTLDLPIMTDLEAADDAIEAGVVVDGKQRTGNRIAECDRAVVATPTVAYVATDIPTGPSPYRVCRRRRLERQVGCAGRLNRGKGGEHRACNEKLFHRTVPPFRGGYASERRSNTSKPVSRFM